MSKRIYLDYAALTPVDPRVLRETKRFSASEYGNPSALYAEGVAAKNALGDARKRVVEFLHVHADEIYFTSGGTEANVLALDGTCRAAKRSCNGKPHVIISAIEHSSIMEVAAMLEKQGVEVTRLPVDSRGVVNLEVLKKAIKSSTYLVSIMAVNNEIGSIQPLKEISKVIRKFKADYSSIYPLFHCDASQAVSFMDMNMEKIGIDLLTLDSSKVYGPRGTGALFVRRGTPIEPVILGGGQENGLRSGTENLSSIAGFAKALQLIAVDRAEEAVRLRGLKDKFLAGLKGIRSDIKLNGPVATEDSAPHILNVAIAGIDNEFFVLQLDARGVACSTKSSCLRDEDESYVLRAIGADSKTSVRFSFGRWTKKRELDRALKAIRGLLEVQR